MSCVVATLSKAAAAKSSHDVRYYVTSIDPDTVTADDLLRYVRGHWQIENSLHFLKDRWWTRTVTTRRRERSS